MRWVEFTQVMISEEDGKLRMAKAARILEASSVYSVVPGTIPSDVCGPGGAPIGTPAAVLLTQGGEQILVDCTVSKALYKLTWEGIDVEGPEGISSADDYIVTKTVKRPVENDTPPNQSNLIL